MRTGTATAGDAAGEPGLRGSVRHRRSDFPKTRRKQLVLRSNPAVYTGLLREVWPGTRRSTPTACGAEGCTAPGEEGRKRRGDRKNIDWAGGAVVDMPPPRSRRRDEYGYFLRSGRRSYCFCRKKTPRRDRCLVCRAPFAASLFLFIFFSLAFLCSVKCSRYTYVLCDPCDPEML